MRVICLVGHSRAGKDTVFDFLSGEDPDLYVRMSLADPIRSICSQVIDWAAKGRGLHQGTDPSKFYVKNKAKPIEFLDQKPTLRSMMQQLGTEWGRQHVSSTVWIDILKGQLAELKDQDIIVVVTDARFQNEIDMIKPDLVVKVDRAGNNEALDPHPSAREIDHIPFDRLFENDSGLLELQQKVRGFHSTLEFLDVV